MSEEKQKEQAAEERRFTIHKIYTKDISFETPNSPQIFSGAQWSPDINLQLSNMGVKLAEGIHEVTLTLTVTAKLEDKTAYLVEVKQAGIFNIEGLNEEEIPAVIGSYCPTILFPYAREVVSDLVIRGGFPQLALNPVNFDALYVQHVKEMKAKQSGEPTTTH
jgi:preprotein translocase subunit SecB